MDQLFISIPRWPLGSHYWCPSCPSVFVFSGVRTPKPAHTDVEEQTETCWWALWRTAWRKVTHLTQLFIVASMCSGREQSLGGFYCCVSGLRWGVSQHRVAPFSHQPTLFRQVRSPLQHSVLIRECVRVCLWVRVCVWLHNEDQHTHSTGRMRTFWNLRTFWLQVQMVVSHYASYEIYCWGTLEILLLWCSAHLITIKASVPCKKHLFCRDPVETFLDFFLLNTFLVLTLCFNN